MSSMQNDNPLALVAKRLTDCLAHETSRLNAGDMADLRSQIAWKSRLLFDLNRAIREAPLDPLDNETRDKLRNLRSALTSNSAAIKANIEAIRELIGIVQATALNETSDGTYKRPSRY